MPELLEGHMVATMICVFASFVFRNKNRLTFYDERYLDFNGGHHDFCTCRFCLFKQNLWVSSVFVLPCRVRSAFALHLGVLFVRAGLVVRGCRLVPPGCSLSPLCAAYGLLQGGCRLG